MSIPLFFTEETADQGNLIQLPEDTARHVSGVLRMREGEMVKLTSGKGDLAIATIVESSKRSCVVKINSLQIQEAPQNKICIAVSLLKNTSRFEWLLEKCAELGIEKIQPVLCKRTEKQQFKRSRFESILKSAMLQSQQQWLTELSDPVNINLLITDGGNGFANKFIAHCEPGQKFMLNENKIFRETKSSTIILIGPEGDFTQEEIQLALQHSFNPVALGNTRLRTETAAVVAATLLKSARW